jgi:hypothetical protein
MVLESIIKFELVQKWRAEFPVIKEFLKEVT